MPETLKKRSVKGTLWSFFDNGATQLIGFVIGIILARLLSPSDYGTVGVLSIFLAIANVFIDCGFGSGLIRKADRTEEDLSTAFYFNVLVGIIAYVILFFSAPLIAKFFRMPILVILLRVLALCLVFNALSIVQQSLLTANLNIKVQAKINVGTQLPMGLVGIYFAYQGFGVWTLVIQQVGSSVLKTILLWIVAKWRPKHIWSQHSFHYLFNYGWKLLGANLIGTIFGQIHSFFIGRTLGASDLGYYSKAQSLTNQPSTMINSVVDRVVLPILVDTHGNKTKIRNVYAKMMRALTFCSFPLFLMLIALAKPIIIILWTDKWLKTVILFQILAFAAPWGPIGSLNLCLLQLLNRTDLTLKLEFVKKPVTLILLLIALPFGLEMIAVSAMVASIYCIVVNMFATKKLLKYGYKKQFRDILPNMLLSIIVALIIYAVTTFISNNWVKCILGGMLYCIMYIGMAKLLKYPALNELLGLYKDVKKNK